MINMEIETIRLFSIVRARWNNFENLSDFRKIKHLDISSFAFDTWV